MALLKNTTGNTGTYRLRILSTGTPGSGKTSLIRTAPGSWGIIPFDVNTRPTVEKAWAEAKDSGRKFDYYIPDTDFIRAANVDRQEYMNLLAAVELDGASDKTLSSMKSMARAVVNIWRKLVYEMASSPDIETIMVDGTQNLVRDVTIAHCGRTTNIPQTLRGAPNAELREIFEGMISKHCIFTHTARDVYVTKTDSSGKSTADRNGDILPEAWKTLGYLTNLSVKHFSPQTEVECRTYNQLLRLDGGKRSLTPGSYAIAISDCRRKPQLVMDSSQSVLTTRYVQRGKSLELVEDEADWLNIAFRVFPEVLEADDVEKWLREKLRWK